MKNPRSIRALFALPGIYASSKLVVAFGDRYAHVIQLKRRKNSLLLSTEHGARAFFERWKDSLKWQRLEPYRKFAELIESQWDGIASYCHPDNKVRVG